MALKLRDRNVFTKIRMTCLRENGLGGAERNLFPRIGSEG
jgi:hypothetical protein